MHAVLHVRSRTKEVACAGLSSTDSELPSAALRPQTVQILAPVPRTRSHGVCDLRRPAYPQMVPQDRLSAAADPMKVTSSCTPILVISRGASSSDLERGNSNPSTNITCMARDPCQPPLVVLSTVQPSSHRCQKLVSHGSHCAAHIAASCGQALLAASKHVDRKDLLWAFSRSIGSTTFASCPSWVPLPCRSPSLVLFVQSVPPGFHGFE